MKKMIVILAMILAFTACGQTDTDNSEAQPSVSPSPEPEFVTVDSAVNILSVEKIKILKSQGVTATVIGKTGEDKTYICLEKNENQLMIEYDYNNPITLNYWGGHIIVVQPDGLEYYSIDNFHYVDTFTVTDFTGRLVDAIPHGHGFLAAYIDGEEYGFAKFRASGGFMYKLPLELENPFVDADGKIVGKTFLTYIDKNQYYTDQSQKQLLFASGDSIADEYDGFIYNLSDNTAHHFRTFASDTDDNGGVYMTAVVDKYSDDRMRDDIPAKIFRLYNGDPTGYIEFDAGLLMGGFFDFDGVEVTHLDENKVEFRSLNSDHIITADFAKRKVSSTISKQMIENGLERLYSNSADGKYSLWKGNGEGGGDVVINSIYLVENATGNVKYIDTIGGMYGGSESAGFFSNGDVYTIGLDEFKVFTTDMSQQGSVFEMSKNFPLGDDAVEKGGFRHLLSARRDPATQSWVVLYNEAPYQADANDWYMDGDLGYNFYKSTYKVGILDPQGNLTKVYDTGEHVMTYDFRQVSMYMEEGDILNFKVIIKGKETQLHGQLDLKTGQYTCISGGYNEWK